MVESTPFPAELRVLGESLPPNIRAAIETDTISRFQLARRMGMTFDGARDNYGVLGYDVTITAQQYRELYRRGGIAGRAVNALPKAVWRGDGELVEDKDPETQTQFEAEWFAMNDRFKVWSTCMRAHILASLGSFSVLLLGAAGDYTTELPQGSPVALGKPGGLIYLQPFGGGVLDSTRGTAQTNSAGATTMFAADVTVASWEQDAGSPRFGQPLTYNLRRTNVVAPELSRPVHWTRCIHIPSEGFLDDAIYGPPALEGVWNYFCDLLKIVGGGGEASWLNMHPGMHMDLDKDVTFGSKEEAAAQVDAMKENALAYKHQLTRWLQTRGVTVTQLQANPTDFATNADTILKLIAGTRGIPLRIMTGSEMGQLASDQDRDNWNDIVRDCRSGYAHPVILRPLIERLVAYGYLTQPAQWEPVWPDVAALTQAEKAAGAERWSLINKNQGETVFTTNEIRDYWYGKPALTDKERAMWDKVRTADQLSINEKRVLSGQERYEGDEETDPQADVPFGLLPRESLRITDTSVPPNVPGGAQPKLSTAEQRMIDKLEKSLEGGGVVNIVVRK